MVLKWIVTTKSHNCQSTLTRVCDSRFEGCTVPVQLVYEPLNHRGLRANAFMCELVSKLCTIGSDREICLTTQAAGQILVSWRVSVDSLRHSYCIRRHVGPDGPQVLNHVHSHIKGLGQTYGFQPPSADRVRKIGSTTVRLQCGDAYAWMCDDINSSMYNYRGSEQVAKKQYILSYHYIQQVCLLPFTRSSVMIDSTNFHAILRKTELVARIIELLVHCVILELLVHCVTW